MRGEKEREKERRIGGRETGKERERERETGERRRRESQKHDDCPSREMDKKSG